MKTNQIANSVYRPHATHSAVRETRSEPVDVVQLASAAELEVNRAWLTNWRANNPWDHVYSSPPAAKPYQLWAQPKRLSTADKKTLKKLLARGIKEKYARQLVERKEYAWIQIMLRRPEKKK